MKIAFGDLFDCDYTIETPYQTPLGGSQSALCYLAEELARQGHEVFLANQTSQPGMWRGVKCLPVPLTNLPEETRESLDFFVVQNVAGHGQRIRPLIGRDTRLILWIHHAHDVPLMQALADRDERESYDRIVFVSEWQRGWFCDRFGIDRERTAIFRNACAPAFYNIFPANSSITAQKYQSPVLAYTSVPWRGLELMIEILPRIRQAVPGTILKVFSSLKVYRIDDELDESSNGHIYRQCQETEGIEYIGSLSQPELARALREVNVLTYPNAYPETSCIATIEAMASGCQIVSTDLGALPETTAGFARLIPFTGDWEVYKEQFAQAVIELLQKASASNPEPLLRDMVDFADRHYTWPGRAREWIEWLEGMQHPSIKQPLPQIPPQSPLKKGGRPQFTAPGEVKIDSSGLPLFKGDGRGIDRSYPTEKYCEGIQPQKVEAIVNKIQAIPTENMPASAGLRLPRSYAETDAHLAELYCYRGEIDWAIVACQRSLKSNPFLPLPYKTLGKALQARGKQEAAIRAYLKAIALYSGSAEAPANPASPYEQWELSDIFGAEQSDREQSDREQSNREQSSAQESSAEQLAAKSQANLANAELYFNLGNALVEREKLDEALQCYRQSLKFAPNHPRVCLNMGIILRQHGQLAAAIDCYRTAIASAPNFAEAHYNLGNVLLEGGSLEEARTSFYRALEIQPDLAPAYCSLANLLAQQGQLEEAIAASQKAVALDPADATAYRNLGNALAASGRVSEARAAYKRSLDISPSDGMRVKLATLLPVIYPSLEEMQAWRSRFAVEIKRLSARSLAIVNPLKEIGATNFNLAYQGQNDKDIQQQIAQIYRPLLPERFAAKYPRNTNKQTGKLRLGFISSYFYQHSVSNCFGRIIRQMSKDRFEIILLAAPANKSDRLTQQFQAIADSFINLPNSLEQSRQIVAELDLYFLTYTDIGMEAFTYFLAFTRLAKFQCVLTGHPVTTGIPTIDYFISSDLMEIESAQEHYTETLVRLPGLPVDYAKPTFPGEPKPKAALGLPENRNLYVCPMMLFKVHPEFDLAIAEILRRDPQGTALFFQARHQSLHQLLLARFQKTIPDVAKRIQFLPWAAATDFMNILMLADVVLDTFHFVGGNTTLITLATGTPMVTWPSPYLRGRVTYGYYRRMGIMDCVAATQSDYVDIAVRIGTDPSYRGMLRKKILQNNAVLYENPEAVDEMVKFFLSQGLR